MADSTSIEDLPTWILIHILSFIPTLDAVRFSLVSPNWRNFWHNTPALNFDMTLYHSQRRRNRLDPYDFADFITETLLTRPRYNPLHSFRLLFSFRHYLRRSDTQVDSWIRHAVTSGVEFLRLSFEENLVSMSEWDYDSCFGDDNSESSFGEYDFHFYDLKNPCSVTVLELVSCRIVWPKSVSSDGFSSLNSVSLRDCFVNDEVIFALVSSCVNLEYLSLSNLQCVQNFKLYSRTLKELELGFHRANVGSLDICAPNLRKISFDSFCVAKYCSKDLSSLIEACVVFVDRGEEDFDWNFCDILRLVTGVELLTLQNIRLSSQVFDTKDISECSAFKNLKYLELQTGYTKCDLVGMAAFLELCPLLDIGG